MPAMTALPLVAYLIAVVWAIMESSQRWMTLLWIVLGLVAAIGTLFLLSLIWPFAAAILGHLAAILGFLVSAVVGLNHMRAHRRPQVPKLQP
jgi:hypothetical protein